MITNWRWYHTLWNRTLGHVLDLWFVPDETF